MKVHLIYSKYSLPHCVTYLIILLIKFAMHIYALLNAVINHK